VRAWGRDNKIKMFDVKNVAIITKAYICNGRRGRLLLERPGRDSTQKGSAVYSARDSKPLQNLGTGSLENNSDMGLTANRLNSRLIFTVTATSASLSAPLEGCLFLPGVGIIVLQ